MKLGLITFEQAVAKLYAAHSIMADDLGEFVGISKLDDVLKVYTQGDERYEFLKSKNESVEVFVAVNSRQNYQYIRMYTEDGDKMDFITFEPSPIITMSELIHPTA
jgi:hypothetical protein